MSVRKRLTSAIIRAAISCSGSTHGTGGPSTQPRVAGGSGRGAAGAPVWCEDVLIDSSRHESEVSDQAGSGVAEAPNAPRDKSS